MLNLKQSESEQINTCDIYDQLYGCICILEFLKETDIKPLQYAASDDEKHGQFLVFCHLEEKLKSLLDTIGELKVIETQAPEKKPA